jgi:hypothetical protein
MDDADMLLSCVRSESTASHFSSCTASEEGPLLCVVACSSKVWVLLKAPLHWLSLPPQGALWWC